ncbi:MAG: hypothetical protein BJ554DRAFT_131, partial [Olpidium bornovanus]
FFLRHVELASSLFFAFPINTGPHTTRPLVPKRDFFVFKFPSQCKPPIERPMYKNSLVVRAQVMRLLTGKERIPLSCRRLCVWMHVPSATASKSVSKMVYLL